MALNWRQSVQDQNHQQYQRTKRIAHKIYLNRQRCNKAGSAGEDWAIASKVVSNPLKRLLFSANQPLIRLRQPAIRSLKFVGWDVPHWFLFKVPQLEWMKLLAVPLLIAVATSIISSQLQRESNQIEALNRYIDQIETLTFEQKLLTDTPASGAIVIARGRTVAALRELDIERKRQLLAFLQASGLLSSADPNNLAASNESPNKEPVISFRLANLSEMDLSGVDLRVADLRDADLRDANLSEADLTNANLRDADLRDAHLKNVYLFRADLRDADLRDAHLKNVYFFGADLREANFSDADLNYARLFRTDMREASLIGADLRNAYLIGADLTGADFTDAIVTGAQFGEGDGLSDKQKQDLAKRGAIFEPSPLSQSLTP